MGRFTIKKTCSCVDASVPQFGRASQKIVWKVSKRICKKIKSIISGTVIPHYQTLFKNWDGREKFAYIWQPNNLTKYCRFFSFLQCSNNFSVFIKRYQMKIPENSLRLCCCFIFCHLLYNIPGVGSLNFIENLLNKVKHTYSFVPG